MLFLVPNSIDTLNKWYTNVSASVRISMVAEKRYTLKSPVAKRTQKASSKFTNNHREAFNMWHVGPCTEIMKYHN